MTTMQPARPAHAVALGHHVEVSDDAPTPSAGWTGTIVRLLFGVIWGVDAYL